jgi:rubrerythrin
MGENLEEVLSKMIKDEESAIAHLGETILKVKNSVAKLILQTMLTDSLKHANILRMILSILEDPIIGKADMGSLMDAIKLHNEEEESMMMNFEEMLKGLKDRRIRFLVEDLVTDEKRHHSITGRMVELMGSTKTSEDEWWELLYRYSRLTR